METERRRRALRTAAGRPGLASVLAVMSLVVGACDAGAGDTSTTSMSEIPTTSSDSAGSSTTSMATASTSLPLMDGPTEVWHYRSGAIGREIGRGEDFATSGGLVAVLIGEEVQGAAVLDLESGQELWHIEFPDSSGRILDLSDHLTWTTYDGVGAQSLDGQPLWDYEFDDTRRPSSAVVRDSRTAVLLDPTTEGDYQPPLVVKFDESGNVLWSAELSEARNDEDLQWVQSILVEGGLIVQTTDALYRLDWESGSQDWRVPFFEADVETFGMTGLLESDGVVYAADPAGEFSGHVGGEILGIDAVTGETLLHRAVGRSPRLVGLVDLYETWLVYTDELGVHGVATESNGSWDATDLPNAVAGIAEGRVIAVSPDTLSIADADGDFTHQVPTTVTEPVLQPVLIGNIVLVPGWQGTTAIDASTGRTLETWPGESYANALQVDHSRAVLGAAGDGVYLLRAP